MRPFLFSQISFFTVRNIKEQGFMDFRSIIKDAAARKLLDLAKVFLEILDELKKEEESKSEKFSSLAEQWGLKGRDLAAFLSVVITFDSCKKDILRKRILDKTNQLTRELEQ